MSHRVAQQHRLRLGEIAVVEHEHEFATVRIETLNRVRYPAGEEPQVVFLHVGDKTLSLRVNRRDPSRAVKHEGPFGGSVPMQLAYAAGSESHVYTRQGFGHREFPHRNFARPTTFVSPLVRKRERVLEVLDQALRACRSWPTRVRVLGVNPRG